jgi:hypothetical protein
MKAIVILHGLLLVVSGAICQQTKEGRQKIMFSTVNQAGLISASNGESAIIQTINGIKKDKWSTGIGVGLDYYIERSIPLFLDIRRDLTDTKNTPFIYADGGACFQWLNQGQKRQRNAIDNYPGLYYDLGAGWKLSGKNKRSFIVSAGYTGKQVREKALSTIWMPMPANTPRDKEYYKYNYRRIVIKVGFQL